MALNKKENNSIVIGLLIIATLTVPLISTQNINCKGKAFHCVNSTHFKICVDLGGGISTTVDDFLIPCPRDTVCKDNNFFECEYQATTTLTPTEQSDVSNDNASVSIWDNFDISTLSTSATSEVDLFRDQGTTFSPDLNSPILTTETVKYSLTSTSLSSANEYNNTNSDISVSANYNIISTASEAVTNIDGFSTKVPKVILNNTINELSNNSTTDRTTESTAQIEPNTSTSKLFLQTQNTTIIYSNDSFSIPITTKNINYIYNESSTETINTKNLLVTLSNESIVTKRKDAKTTTDANSNSPTLHSLTDQVSTTQYENVTSPDENLKNGSITDELDKLSTNPVPLSTTDINNNELHIEKNNLNTDLNKDNSTTENIVIESNVPNIFQSNNEQLIKDNVTEILNISKTTIFDNLAELNTMSTVSNYEPVPDMTIDKYILPTPTVSNLNMSAVESYTHIANSVKNSFVTSSPFDKTNTEPLQNEYINYITNVIKNDTIAKSSDIKSTIIMNSTQPIKIYDSLNSTELINESISKKPLTNFKNSYISQLKKIEGESTVGNYVLNSNNNNNNSDIPFTQHLTDLNLNTQSTITYKTDLNINYEFLITNTMDAVKEQPTSYTDINYDKITTPIVTLSYLNSDKLSPTTNNDGTFSKSEVILSGIESTTISIERDTSTTISSKNTITQDNILDNKDNLPHRPVDNINLTKYLGSEIKILPPISINTTTINTGDSITKDSSAPKNFTVKQEENYTLVNIKSPNLNLNEINLSTNRNILTTSISDNERNVKPLATTNAPNDIYDRNKIDLTTSNAVFNYSIKIEEISASTDVQNVSLNETYLNNNSNNNYEATSTYNDITKASIRTNDRQNIFLDDKHFTNSYTTGIVYNEITEATSTTISPQKVNLDKMSSSNNSHRNILTTSTAGLIYNELTETTTSKIDANTVNILNSVKVITSEDKKIGQQSYIPQVTDSSFMMSTVNFKNVSSYSNETHLKEKKKVKSFNYNITSLIDDRENKQSVFTTETVNVNSNYIENVFNEDLTSNPKELINNTYVSTINNNIKESNNHSLKNSTVNLLWGYSLQNLSKDDHFTNINNISNFDILTVKEPVNLENKKVNDPLNTNYINLLSTPKNIYLNKSQIISSTQVKDTESRGSNTNYSIINSLSDETKIFNISSAGKTFVTSLNNLETTTVPYISKELETTSFKREGYVEQNLLNTLYYSKDHANVKTNVLPHSEIELKNIKNSKDSSINNNVESFTQDTETLSSALFSSPKPIPVQKIENRKVTQNTLDNTTNSFSKDFSIQINHAKDSLNITEDNNKNKSLTNNLATIKYEASSRPTISKNNIFLEFNGNNKSKDDLIAFTLHDRILNNTLIESDVKNKTAVNDKGSIGSYNEINNIKPITTSTRKSISSGTSHNIMHTKAVMSARQFICKKRGKYSDKNDCNKFYICIGKFEPIVGICPQNTVFSEIRKQCTRNLAHCIRNNQFRCMAPGRFIDVLTNKFYYICVKKIDGYVRFKLTCKEGYYLNIANIQCLPDSVEDISVSKKSTQDTISTESKHSKEKENFICKEEGKFVYSNDCKKYYVCKKNSKSQFRRKLKECDSDEIFDKDTRKCVENDSYE